MGGHDLPQPVLPQGRHPDARRHLDVDETVVAGQPHGGVRGRRRGGRGGDDRVRFAAGGEPGTDTGRVAAASLAEQDGEHPYGEQEHRYQGWEPDRELRGGLTTIVVVIAAGGPWLSAGFADVTVTAAQNVPARARCTRPATAALAAELVTAA